MVACDKKEQVVSEQRRKSFSGQYKAKVALEAIRGVKTANEIAQEFGGASDPGGVVEEGIAGTGIRHIRHQARPQAGGSIR